MGAQLVSPHSCCLSQKSGPFAAVSSRYWIGAELGPWDTEDGE